MKKMKLNKTLYFDETGFDYDTFEEAKSESYDPKCAYFVKSQTVKVYEASEIKEKPLIDYKYYVYSMSGNFLFASDELDILEEIKSEVEIEN